MNKDKFWKLIEDSILASQGNFDKQVDILKSHLVKLPVEDIVKFDRIFYEYYAQTKISTLWAAADLIEGWCSDDRFDYFRAWVIGQGKAVFDLALDNPDNLADIDSIILARKYSGELLMYAASEAYEEKTGEEDFDELSIEGEESIPYQEITLDWVDETKQAIPSRLKTLLPKLYHRFRKE
ncbi:DUF4240 domain-containing protein [Rhodocytophaga aerolata]|uniref:DUF4240 domain-containing protein n=1 Tax=Rhodocytophaga aerolata TaxID=455078 RepID=A0ABT8RJ34_9BACT|nr:DUF4240 domain-containing protein [Rhodocytophaga aerolata]MDO1451208.1 DUF4240 domain-containing protein [Rhodocytophaga aerolata]